MSEVNGIDKKIEEIRTRIEEARKELADLRQKRPPENLGEYTFQTANADLSLSELFGEKSDLIVIHNMGARCVYCTLWADGFNGMTKHLEDRAAFWVISPDESDAQKKFASSR